MPPLDNGKVAKFADDLLADRRLDSSADFSLDEFADLYHAVSTQVSPDTRVDIVLLGDYALAQFSEITSGSGRVLIRSESRLSPADFRRIVANPEFHGDVLATSLRGRLKEEWRNIAASIVVGLVIAMLLFALVNSQAANYASFLLNPTTQPAVGRVVDSLISVNQLLLTSATLFLSLFLVFTVAQNARLQSDARLFDSGLLHKYARDDTLVALTALGSFLVSIVNIVLIHFPTEWPMGTTTIGSVVLVFNKISVVNPALAGIAAAAMSFCYLALLYYLRRTNTITDRDMAQTILRRAARGRPMPDSMVTKEQPDRSQ